MQQHLLVGVWSSDCNVHPLYQAGADKPNAGITTRHEPRRNRYNDWPHSSHLEGGASKAVMAGLWAPMMWAGVPGSVRVRSRQIRHTVGPLLYDAQG